MDHVASVGSESADCTITSIRVETGSGHPDHILSGSSGSDPVYKLSGSDPDSTLNHVR